MKPVAETKDSSPYAEYARDMLKMFIKVHQRTPELGTRLRRIDPRDFELLFLLYAAIRHKEPAPFGDACLYSSFVQLSHEFRLPLPLLAHAVRQNTRSFMAWTPDLGAHKRPNLEAIVRECKERNVESHMREWRERDVSTFKRVRRACDVATLLTEMKDNTTDF